MDNNKKNKISQYNKRVKHDLYHVKMWNGDIYFIFIYRKIEKIASALYMLSNFFSADEPLKWSLRKSTMDLVVSSTSLKNQPIFEQKQTVTELVSLLFTVISLLEIAYKGEVISEMNYAIITDELWALTEVIESGNTSKFSGGGFVIGHDFFDTYDEQTPKSSRFSSVEKKHKETEQEQEIKDKGQNYKGQNSVLYKNNEVVVSLGDKKEKRKKIILDLLKNTPGLGIKDFSNIIKDCSEKTIQRELQDLVHASVLKKQGERRWSTYSLA